MDWGGRDDWEALMWELPVFMMVSNVVCVSQAIDAV